MNRIDERWSKKICFVAPGLTAIYSLLSSKNPEKIGGPDIHLFLLIKELAKHNFKVSVIVYGAKGTSVEYINNIEIIKIKKSTLSIKILDILVEVFRICIAMKKTNAHTYVQRGGMPGTVSLYCRWANKKFVYSIASDALVNPMLMRKVKDFNSPMFSSLAAFGNYMDIKLADVVVVQNECQRDNLKRNYNTEGMLIKKPFPLTGRGITEKAEPPIILWVGAMAEVKQPELFLNLAKTMPNAIFQVIGGPSSNNELYDGIREKSLGISNIEFLGIIPFHEINEYFSQASVLVNTSIFEAYPPYAFLQAWMNYTPVVSLHDNSDEILIRYDIGFHSKTFDQLVIDVKTLLKEDQLREVMGKNGREYVENYHDNKKIIGKYFDLFDSI